MGKVFAIATPMVIGSIGKMCAGQKMDPQGLTSLRGKHPKASHAVLTRGPQHGKQLMGAQKDIAGVIGIFKKFLGN